MMRLYHAYIAGQHKLDRIDFFLVERRSKEELRQILRHFGLHQIRQMIRSKQVTLKEAEELCIIASKLLKWPEVEGLQDYVEKVMGIDRGKFFAQEIEPPLKKAALQDDSLRLALQKYHQDGLFLPLWTSPYYPIPVKIGGFVVREAQFILKQRAAELDSDFTNFVQDADTLDDLLGEGER